MSSEHDRWITETVDKTLARMTDDDKLAQLQGIRSNRLVENGKLSVRLCREFIPNGIGHVCQFASSLTLPPDELRDFVRQFQRFLTEETPSGIPAIFHEEAITGFAAPGATTLPQQIGMSCSWNPGLIERNSGYIVKNMRDVGGTMVLSPMMDVCKSVRWGRMEEGFGEDPYLTATLGLAFIQGMQGGDLREGVAATAKHFAGFAGGTDDVREFMEETMLPHEVAVKLGRVQNVMTGYHLVDQIPCTANKNLLTHILRGQYGFEGSVISDYCAVDNLHSQYGYAKSRIDAGIKAINAGTDVELSDGTCFPYLKDAIAAGYLDRRRLDVAVRRVLELKAYLGLLDIDPVFGKSGSVYFDMPEQRASAYESACQSLVLLKNNGILPLRDTVRRIALVGPNAGSWYGQLGDYTYQSLSCFFRQVPVNPEAPKLVTVLEGMRSKAGDIGITHERGCEWNKISEINVYVDGDSQLNNAKINPIKDQPQPDPANAIKIAEDSDTIIAVMGENIYHGGEGRSRNINKFAGRQEDFVKSMIATGKPVVLVIFSGRPIIIDQLAEGCAAIIQAWFPGEEGGNAVSDLLLGNINPSGKLTMSYPMFGTQEMLSYSEGYKVDNMPLYPFGHGLSYTSYEYSELTTPDTVETTGSHIPVSCKIRNTGQRAGCEIVQMYVHMKDETRSRILLKGFHRVELDAGQVEGVDFQLPLDQLAAYIDGKWTIKPGSYEIMIAASSTDIRLRKTVKLTGTRALPDGRTVFYI